MPLPRALLTATESIPETPTYYTIAQKYPKWREAIGKEFIALLANNTWSLVPSSMACNIVTCKWVFQTKCLTDGSIERRKVQLVAIEFLQQSGVDFEETSSPVGKATIIICVLTLAVSHHWPIRQYDVQNVFLHGPLTKTVFMAQPLGFTHSQFPSHVCKLHKAIYGLCQSPHALYSLYLQQTPPHSCTSLVWLSNLY